MKKSRRYGKRLLAGILCAAMLFTNDAARGISVQAAEVNPAGNETPTTEISDAETEPKDETESEKADEPTKSEETSGETGDTSDESAGDQESSDGEADKGETENLGGEDQSGEMEDTEGGDDKGGDAEQGENDSEEDAVEDEVTDENEDHKKKLEDKIPPENAGENTSISGNEIQSYAAASSFAGGSGREDDPYLIANVSQLYLLAEQKKSGFYKLTQDIYLNDNIENPQNLWEPVSFNSYLQFDGDHHTIYNLYINSEQEKLGLFVSTNSVTYYPSVISNLSVENAKIVCPLEDEEVTSVGGINIGIMGIGMAANNCSIRGKVSITVKSEAGVGGIVSSSFYDTEPIEKCTMDADLTVTNNSEKKMKPVRVGGIAYQAVNVMNCKNRGSITVGYGSAAGIVDTAKTVENCTNEGTVTVINGNACGIAGGYTIIRSCAVQSCINTKEASVIAKSGHATGIKGHTHSGDSTTDILQDCTNYGTVTGEVSSGIIDDICGGSIINCNNEGILEGEDKIAGIAASVSGDTVIRGCKNLADIKVDNSFHVSGIADSVRIGGNKVVIAECINEGELSSQSGYVTGIVRQVYVGSDDEQEERLIENCHNKGNLSGVYASGIASEVGTSSNYYGNIVIKECDNQGEISGTSSAGGIVGFLYQGKIDACYNLGKIWGNSYVGGIASHIASYTSEADSARVEVTACYNLGDITGEGQSGCYLGGIVGWMSDCGRIAKCYNRGKLLQKSESEYTIGDTGGIAGLAFCSTGNKGNIEMTDCFNCGDISSDGSYIGGIVGSASIVDESSQSITISRCYNVGHIENLKPDKGLNSGIGIMDNSDKILAADNYCIQGEYRTQDMGIAATEYSETQMMQTTNYQNWDFNATWKQGSGKYLFPILQGVGEDYLRLGTSYIPEETTIADMKITKDKLTVTVHDENTKKGIAGASVTVNGVSYITDEDGVALLEASVEKVRTNITVTAEGYENSITSVEAANGMLIHIFMIPQSSNLRITQAIANMNGSNYDLLREKLILGYYQDINEITNKQTDSFILTVKTNHNAKLYELLSKDGTVVIQNTSGTFTIPVTTGGTITGGGTIQAKMPIQSTLKQGKYQLRVTDDSGHAETVGIGLTSTVSYKLKERQKITGKASIGSSMEVPIPENVPLIGGGTFTFGLEDELPIDISIDDDGKLKVAFNKPADQDFNQYKENYNHLAKKAKTASQLARHAGDIKGFGAGYFDIGGSICGYGEGNISELDEGTITVKVGVIAMLEGTGGYKHYFMAGVVPINLFLEGEASVGADMNASVSMKNWKITGFDFTGGSMTGKVGLTVGGGIGIGIELNASGNGSVNYVWKPAKKYQKAWFEGSLKAEAVLLFYHKTLWESEKYSYTIMEKGSDERCFQGSNSNGVQETDFVPLSRSYLEYSQGYLNIMSNSKDSVDIEPHSSNDKTVVKAAVYPSAAPIMTQVGNTRYLFWVEDIASRSANNIGAIVYAESEDGDTWSEPKRLLPETEDGTFDGSFNIFTSESKIYITWQDGTKVLEDSASIEQILKSMVIRRAVFDTQSGSVSVTDRLMQESGYYMYPCSAAQGDTCYTAYVHNTLDSGDIYGNNTQSLYCIKEGNETAISLPLPENGMVINMTAGIFDGKESIVCEIDTDGSLATSEDREIYLWDMKEGSQTKLTDNETADSMPTISQSGNIYWYQDGNIMRLKNHLAKAQGIWAEQALTAPVCFAVATNQDNQDMILWEMTDSNKPDGTVAVYGSRETSDDTWENPSKCAESQGTIASRVSASGDWEHLKIAHLEGSFLEDGTMLKDLCILSRKDMTDISLDSVEFDAAQVRSGEVLPLQAFITNCGNTIVDSVQFCVDGSDVQNISSLNLQPGESRNITVDDFTIPADLNGKREFTVTVVTQGDWIETNNTHNIMLETTKYTIDTSTRLDDGGTWLDFTVWNEGKEPTSGIARVHKSTEKGDVIFETNFSALPSENGYSCSVDLSDYENSVTHYYVEALPDYAKEETDTLHEFVYIGYGSGVEETLESDADFPVSSIALSDIEIFLKAGESKKLSVITDTGTTLSNQEILWGSYNTSIASIERDGTITAHRNGDTYITVAYGDLQRECIVHVGETNQKTYSVTFDTQGGDPIRAITGLQPGDVITLPENANKTGKIFLGWYTLSSGGEKIEDSTMVIQKSIILYAHWGDAETTDGFWVSAVPDQIYTGKAIKPTAKVYDGNKLLELNKDYAVSYTNNVKANNADSPKKAPTIIISGKDNYSGKETITFKILPVTLTETNMTVSDMTKVYNKKTQKPIPSITINGRKLKHKTDFTVSYPDDAQGAYQAVGTYSIVVTGKGNYTGEQTLTFAITDKTPISRVTVAKIPNQAYSGEKITPAPVVKYKKSTLVEHVDYELEYRDNVEIGTAALILRGKGDYVGSKTVSFQITGGSLKKAKVTGLISPVVYTGTEIRQNAVLTIKVNGTDVTLQSGKDYTVSYQNNVKAGTAKVIYKGINGYTGTIQKKYKITPYDILSDEVGNIRHTDNIVCAYLKGGSRPEPDIYFKDTLLKKDVDYTLSYKNNNAIGGSKTPTVIVKGKGSFKNKFEIPFTIKPQDLSNMTLAPCDKVYKPKANIYKITPKLLDANGKALSAGKDFDKNSIAYTYEKNVTLEDGTVRKAGDTVGNTDIIPADTPIRITLTCGSGNLYEGTFTGTYRIVAADIKSARVTIPAQIYTGSEIRPDKTQMTVKVSKVELSAEDYDILSYSNNVKKGKASVTINGKGNYGGTKTVKFTIRAKGFLWWWR